MRAQQLGLTLVPAQVDEDVHEIQGQSDRRQIDRRGTLARPAVSYPVVVAEPGESAKSLHWRLKATFWLDGLLAISVCALQTVPGTGLIIHEWLGLAVIGMAFAHLLFSWNWISSISRRLFARHSLRARINYVLNLALFAAVTAVIYSGIQISQKAVPVLTGSKGAEVMDWRWDALHHDFANAVLMLAGFHVAMNWEWVLAAGQKIFRRVLDGVQ